MAKKTTLMTVLIVLFFIGTTVAGAKSPDQGYQWNDHPAPFDYQFNNLIDNHQQSNQLPNGRLKGFIYIQVVGETEDGIPIARRADCDDPNLDCRVGWNIQGIPIQATLVQNGPRLWQIDEAQMAQNPTYVHFHWTALQSGDKNPKKPCGLEVGRQYSGYLLKRTAVTTFYWLGGNDDKETGRLVTPGVDLHSNIDSLWQGGGGNGSGGGGPGDGDDGGGYGGHDGGDTGGGGPGGGDTGGGCGDHDGGDTGGGGPGGGDTGGGCGGHDGGDTGGGCGGHDGGDTGGGGPGGGDIGGGCGGHDGG